MFTKKYIIIFKWWTIYQTDNWEQALMKASTDNDIMATFTREDDNINYIQTTNLTNHNWLNDICDKGHNWVVDWYCTECNN